MERRIGKKLCAYKGSWIPFAARSPTNEQVIEGIALCDVPDSDFMSLCYDKISLPSNWKYWARFEAQEDEGTRSKTFLELELQRERMLNIALKCDYENLKAERDAARVTNDALAKENSDLMNSRVLNSWKSVKNITGTTRDVFVRDSANGNANHPVHARWLGGLGILHLVNLGGQTVEVPPEWFYCEVPT